MLKATSEVDHRQLSVRSALALGFGGVLPFWAWPLTGWVLTAYGEGPALSLQQWVLTYAGIIVSFMAGGRWAFSLIAPDPRGWAAFGGLLGGIVPALLAWVIIAAPSPLFGGEFSGAARGALLAGLLIFQLVQDADHGRLGGLPSWYPWYLTLRKMLVAGAATPLLLPVVVRTFKTIVGAG